MITARYPQPRLVLTTTLLLLVFGCVYQTVGSDWVSVYDRVLKTYVTPNGVKYQSWKNHREDRQALAMVTDAIAKQSLTGMDQQSQLAFYLNAYNAWILHKILEDYPTKGPGGGGFIGRTRFFRSKQITVAGKRTSFHLLENDLIRPQFNEPRIHFALNCASASCPPLHAGAFSAATLDCTLDSLAKAFINENPLGFKRTKPNRVEISEIFKWYAEDFEAQGTVRDYLNQYLETDLSPRTVIRYQDYQWTLNEAK